MANEQTFQKDVRQGLPRAGLPRLGAATPLRSRITARRLLQTAFVAAPLLAGSDKFTNFMVNWEEYLAPGVARRFGTRKVPFMKGVGVVEMAAGVGVALKPEIFSYVVAGWLGGIISNLLMKKSHYDVALRDVGLLLSALALGQLSLEEKRKKAAESLH